MANEVLESIRAQSRDTGTHLEVRVEVLQSCRVGK